MLKDFLYHWRDYPIQIKVHTSHSPKLFTTLLGNFRRDFLLLMDVNEWTSYECSDEGTYTQNSDNPSTRSHPSAVENRN